MEKDYIGIYSEELQKIKEMFNLSEEEDKIINEYIDNIIVEFQDVHKKILEKNNFENLTKIINNIIEEINDGKRET